MIVSSFTQLESCFIGLFKTEMETCYDRKYDHR